MTTTTERNNGGEKPHWFQWERQATVHPIMLCMEAWMEPMKKEYGRPWPTTVMIYNSDLVGWYNLWPELLDYGQYLIDMFSDDEKLAELDLELKRQMKELEGMFERFDRVTFRSASDSELLGAYEEIHKRWVRWFVPGGLTEPIGHQGEKLLARFLEKRLDAQQRVSSAISTLTTSTRESFSRKELRELLEIVIAKSSGVASEALDADIDAILETHVKKYYWIHNNYFTTEVLDYHFFLKELKVASEKYHDPKKQLESMKQELHCVQEEKERLMKELDFGADERKLVKLLDVFAWYQDCRKEYTMRMLHYLELILAEIGARKGIPAKDMKYSMASEIPEIMAGKFDSKKLKERMRRCLFYWDNVEEKFEFGSGQFSLDKEKEIFHAIKHEDDIVEVSGMVASKGIVRGRARVTMSAKDAALIEKGEILVTSMTTPDFVTALKRAAAVVTNEGGVLCHAAVISREFGIPCIVGTRIATKVFKTGDMIEVDGSLGVVKKIRE